MAYWDGGLDGKSRSYSVSRLRQVAKADSSREYRCCRRIRRFARRCRVRREETPWGGTEGEGGTKEAFGDARVDDGRNGFADVIEGYPNV